MVKAKNQAVQQPDGSASPKGEVPPGTPPTTEPTKTDQDAALQNQTKPHDVVSVKTLPGVARFCRGGLCFGPEPIELQLDGLAAGVLEQLQAEPNLLVSLPIGKE